MTRRLHVPAIGGVHQFAHFLPVAFELQRRGTFAVTIFVPNSADAGVAADLAKSLGYAPPPIVTMDLPAPLAALVPAKSAKMARLLAWANRLRACDAILCAERTSTILKRLPGQCPPLIHIPHGAGDRAVGFEPRFRYFDHVIVAGRKDRARLLAAGLAQESGCTAAGPIKVCASLRMRAAQPRLFADDRPIILYNPHFSGTLSSVDSFARPLVEAVLGDDRYNLVIAPHVRLAKQWGEKRRAQLTALAKPGRVIVDLGSQRSVDMSYTLGADIYIGDVSSQVYEFLVQPRPCLFVNAHDAQWQGNPDYAMWQLGEVITPDCDVPAAIDRAFRDHPQFRPAQIAGAQAALDGLDWDEDGQIVFGAIDPIAKAADIIGALQPASR